MAAMAQPF